MSPSGLQGLTKPSNFPPSLSQVFSGELPIFLRESKARLYRVDTYFLGKTIAELPLFLTVPIMFTAIAYPLIGLHPGAHYFAIAVTVVALVANVSMMPAINARPAGLYQLPEFSLNFFVVRSFLIIW